MNFKQWLLSEDIYPNNTAVVFHRTCPGCDEKESVKSVSNILTSNFKAGSGCYYGCGLYTTINLESQFTGYMSGYGHAVIKFKVTDLDKYLIFQLSTAKQIHGENYKISDQLKKLGVINQVTDKRYLDEYDKRQEQEIYSSKIAINFYHYNSWIANSIKGIIYRGESDGYCLLKYEPVNDGTISMLGYAVANSNDFEKMHELQANKGWITSTDKAKIKHIYDLPVDRKLQYNTKSSSESFLNKILKTDPKFYEYLGKKYQKEIDNLDNDDIKYLLDKSEYKYEVAKLIINYKKELSYSDFECIINSVTEKDKDSMAKIIIENKPELSENDVKNLLFLAKEKDLVAELIINNKPELSDRNVDILIQNTVGKDKIAELIINKKKVFSEYNVYYLLKFAKDKDKIAELLQKYTDNISKLSAYMVSRLIFTAKDKEQITRIIIKYKKELSGKDVEILLRYSFPSGNLQPWQKNISIDKIAELLQKDTDNISKLSVDNIRRLFENESQEYKNKLEQILNNYHQKKTPEIQEEIDKYL